MIEALYKALPVDVSTNQSAVRTITGIIDTLSASGNAESVDFLQKRVVPIFSRPSLTDVLKDIQTKYARLKVVEILDHKIINLTESESRILRAWNR
jgi:hypothetical protein